MTLVDWRASISLTGTILKWLSVPLLFPLAIAVYSGVDVVPFVVAIVITVGVGIGLEQLDPNPDLGPRETFLMVSVAWFAVSVIGAIPYLVAGNGTIAHPVNALFESMSGFTTTGSTVVEDISFDTHSASILMWRQMTQWIGGMGIIVLGVAILARLAVGGANLMEAEAPGPEIQKLAPSIVETARILWIVYFGITAVYVSILYGYHLLGFAPSMDLYNAVAHGFTTMPTGGFSPESRSIEAFSPIVQWTVIPFILLVGTNFALLWHILSDLNLRDLLENAEFRLYIALYIGFSIILFSVLTIEGQFATTEATARQSLFQVATIMTTTGYASTDFELWSAHAKMILLLCMFLGGSTASTSGGIKILRWLIVLKSIRNEMFRTIHPDAVRPVKLGNRVVDDTTIRGIYLFILLYFVIFAFATLFVSLDANRAGLDISMIEVISGVAATLGNIGPGFGALGPMGNYLELPVPTRSLMIVLMWLGRLEILTVLVIFTPGFWRT